jgi:hemerythrin-like domain-containing protein
VCSYCGCESIEVVGRFMAEHDELINASGHLRRACDSGDATAITAAIGTLTSLLGPHTRAEEVGLFAVLAEDAEFTEHVHGLCAEHEQIDALLAAVAAAGDTPTTGDPEADRARRRTAYDAFEHLLRRHIDHEDNGLFPAAAIAFAGPEWERVAALTPDR